MKLRLCSGLTLILLFLSAPGCRQNNAEISHEKTPANLTEVTADKNIPLQQEVKDDSTPANKRTENKNGELLCSPQRLRRGDVLTLTMSKPHGSYLEIITPSKEYIFLSSEDGDKLLEDARKYKPTPYYAASDLAQLSELRIDTAKAMTIDYKGGEVNGKLLLERIFAESGKYKILLSKDSFETDDPTITGQCEVYYTRL